MPATTVGRKRADTAPVASCKWVSPSVALKRSSIQRSQKAEESNGVISRDEFLAGRVLFMKKKSHSPPSYHLWTESIEVVSPTVQPAPPPGLELPCEDKALPEKYPEPIVELAPPIPEEEYKVLLQNLPEAMLNECMLRVMLEQAKLMDVSHVAVRASGKALITFATYDSVPKCIYHFSGRQWGASKKLTDKTLPVIATYVKTIQRAAPFQMSADAPVFQMSADAPVFQMPTMEKKSARNRFYSDASTDVGPESDEARSRAGSVDSEPEQVTVTS